MCTPSFAPRFLTWVAGFVVAIPSGLFDIGTLADLSNIGTLFALFLFGGRHRTALSRRNAPRFRVPFGPIIRAKRDLLLPTHGRIAHHHLDALPHLAHHRLAIYFLYSRHRSEFAKQSKLIAASVNKVLFILSERSGRRDLRFVVYYPDSMPAVQKLYAMF